jgi:hypothetical protein
LEDAILSPVLPEFTQGPILAPAALVTDRVIVSE